MNLDQIYPLMKNILCVRVHLLKQTHHIIAKVAAEGETHHI